MIATGQYFQGIVHTLSTFRTEIEALSSLGLYNENRHAENFIMRILNLTYNYELENLNKKKRNFPGLDLGDAGEGIGYQITATKTPDKIEETLTTCLKHKHYETYPNINVFILTRRLPSYKIKTDPSRCFTFSPDQNIQDIDGLLKVIEHIAPIKIKALNDYIEMELEPVIKAIKENKPDTISQLLNIDADLSASKMPFYSVWRSVVVLKTSNLSVPKMHAQLGDFLSTGALKNQFLPLLNPALRQPPTQQKLLFKQPLQPTGLENYFFGNAMLLEQSAITIERANYTNDTILANLRYEMLTLLTCILFLKRESKNSFEVEIAVSLETNGTVYFHPPESLVLDRILNSFSLDSPFSMNRTISDSSTATLADLLQEIMHAFIAREPGFLSTDPYITIDRAGTEFVINNIKRMLGVAD